ncbi:hypothetical protein R3P38DRAFT_2848618 [Favolaschia claudopus]|uniref:CFEM domain-containing protein n=1 Tax=Favolaschia claudopus TaxID=2862362 RepID=A0AAW0DSR7_9AGAR
MKLSSSLQYTLTSALCLVSAAAGQATNLPQCAVGCAQKAATTVGCKLSDSPCLCKTTFASSVMQCAGTTSCSPADHTTVSTMLEAMCLAVSGSSVIPSLSLSVSISGSLSVPVSPPSRSSLPVSVTETTITSTVTSVSPPRTTTITTRVPISSNTVIPPPISPSLSSGSPSVPSASVTAPSVSGSAPSTSPSPSTTGGAAAVLASDVYLRIGSAVVVGLLGLML